MNMPAIIQQDFTGGNSVRLIRGGKAYFDLLLQLVSEARQTIHLQAYIISDDDTGKMVAEALVQAARRKVAVFVLADGYASQSLGDDYTAQLREAGVHFRFFEPFLKSRYFYFGRRLHQKIFVADAAVALVGGINIGNRYNDLPGAPAWLDFALLVRGPVAQQLCHKCQRAWNGWVLTRQKQPSCENDAAATAGLVPVRVRSNDWVRHRNEISGTYIQMLRSAQRQVTIFCSYFLPGRFMRRLLKAAAKRGVQVRVVTAGPSDVRIAKNAERWMYDWLLRHNIAVYEYEASVLHAKIALCDTAWLTVGSYNINDISAYASIELNLDVADPVFTASVQQELDDIILKQCSPVTAAAHQRHKNIFKQFVRWVSYEVVRLIFYSVTFYYRQHHNR